MAIYTFGPFRLDTEAEILFRGADPVALGQRAIALLRVLVERPGVPVSKDALIEAAWLGLTVEESNLTVQMAALRRVFDQEPGGERWIETLPRRGYRFVGSVVARDRGDATGVSSTVADRPLALRFGQDVAVTILSFRSQALWFLGYPEAARADAQHALQAAHESGHAGTLMYALSIAPLTHFLSGDYGPARTLAEKVIALADERGVLFWKALGMMN